MNPLVSLSRGLLWILLLWSLGARADEVVVNEDMNTLKLWKHADYTRDDSGHLKINDWMQGQNLPEMKPITEHPVVGFYKGAIWARFTLTNTSAGIFRGLIQLGCGILSEVDLYEIDQGRVVTHRQGGLTRPGKPNYDIHSRLPTFIVELNPGTSRTYYLRMASRYAYEASVNLYGQEAFFESEDHSETLFAIYMGVILVMIVYNLFIAFSLKEWPYLYYCLSIFFTHLCALGGSFGLIHQYVAHYVPWWSEAMLGAAQGLAIFFSFTFFQEFVHAPRLIPRGSRFLRAIGFICLALAVASLVAFHYVISIAVTLFIQLGQPVLITFAVYLMVKGNKEARNYVLASTFFLTTAFVYVLALQGFLPVNGFTLYSSLVGGGLEVVLLSFALSGRIQSMQKDRYLMQKKLLEVQKDINKQLEREVAEKTVDLRQANLELQEILDNVPVGIMAVDTASVIQRLTSSHIAHFYPPEQYRGKRFMVLIEEHAQLNHDLRDRLQVGLEAALGTELMNFEANSHVFPKEVVWRDASGTELHVQMLWKAVPDASGSVQKIMISLIDVSELRELQTKAERYKKNRSAFDEIIRVPGSRMGQVMVLCQEFQSVLTRVGPLSADAKKGLLRRAHTLKGNARVMGLDQLALAIHDFETALVRAEGPVKPGANALDMVFAVYQSHWQLLKDYAHSTEQHNAGLAGDLPLAALLAPMIELIERTATALKKPYPLIEVSCCELPIRKEWHGPLLDSLTHLLTNAIDHGLEDRDERRASGKAELGCITLHLEPSARGMKLVVSDVGRGIDLEKFRRLAKAPDTDDLSLVKALLFKDGFSTRETVSQHSGRGVGLAAVRDSLESSGLTVDIMLAPADGTARERQALAFVIGFPDDAATPTAA